MKTSREVLADALKHRLAAGMPDSLNSHEDLISGNAEVLTLLD